MVVPVPLVGRVPMSVVEVVDVIAVLHGGVSTAGAVFMGVSAVRDVLARFALVPVARVLAVEMTVVGVVDVIAVQDSRVAAGRAMGVLVRGMLLVEYGHDPHPCLGFTMFVPF